MLSKQCLSSFGALFNLSYYLKTTLFQWDSNRSQLVYRNSKGHLRIWRLQVFTIYLQTLYHFQNVVSKSSSNSASSATKIIDLFWLTLFISTSWIQTFYLIYSDAFVVVSNRILEFWKDRGTF